MSLCDDVDAFALRRTHQLAEHAQRGRTRPARIDQRPSRICNFADVEIATGISRKPVGREEVPRREARPVVSDPRQNRASMGQDADSGSYSGIVAVDLHERTQFPREAKGVRLCIHVERTWTVQVVPLSLITALVVEELNAVVFAIRDEDHPITVAADIVHDVEASRVRAGFSPGEQKPAIGRILVDPRVPVTVRNIDIAVRRHSRVRATAEWHTAHRRRGTARNSESKDDTAIRRALPHGVVAVIGAIDEAVRP